MKPFMKCCSQFHCHAPESVYHKTLCELRNSHIVLIAVKIISDCLSKRKLRGDNSKLQQIEVIKCKNEHVKTSPVRF